MVCRILGIIFTTILIVLAFQCDHLVITPYFLMVLLLIQAFGVFRKERSENERIIAHLEAVLLGETSNSTAKDEKSLYYRMDRTLEEVRGTILHSHIENEENTNLFNALLNHITIGLVTFDSEGVIGLINKAARNLLSVNYLSNINQIGLFTSEDKKELLDFGRKVKKVINLTQNGSVYVESSSFILREKQIRILSLQNIKEALDEKELDSWNILVGTLNHEIMNSITPISSLASSALSLLDDKQNPDLTEAIETIDRRSRNLLTFVENFKRLSQIPRPQMKLIQVKRLVERISVLMSSYVDNSKATLRCDVEDEQIMIFADSAQMEQVLINLIKNGIEAGASEIVVGVEADASGKIILLVRDNGTGFSTESAAKACIPFYTTKPEGSGLGLSIVKQIMHLHDGEVRINSNDKGSEIALLFS